MGNSLDHIREIMGTSMEALIHHFKLVTEGFRVPAGPGRTRPIESPARRARRATSSPTAAPARTGRTSATRRFNNLQAVAGDVRGRPGRRRHRRRRLASTPSWEASTADADHRRRPRDAARRRTPQAIIARYPRAALGAAADAAPGAERGGLRHARRDRVLRRAARPDRPPRSAAVATFYTQYKRQPNGEYHGRRLHQHAVRGHGRRRDLRRRSRSTSASATTRPPRTARSPSSASSATRPATTRPW